MRAEQTLHGIAKAERSERKPWRVKITEEPDFESSSFLPYFSYGKQGGRLIYVSRNTGQAFPVKPQVATLLDNLRIGFNNAKTSKELSTHRGALSDARKAIQGKGPQILTVKDSNGKSGGTKYYFEDERRTERLRTFEGDEQQTRIRFDTESGRYVVSVGGVRKEAMVHERAKVILEALLREVNGEVRQATLMQVVADAGFDTDFRIRDIIKSMRRLFSRLFNNQIIRHNGDGNKSVYSIQADVVELFEKDGAVTIPTHPEKNIAAPTQSTVLFEDEATGKPIVTWTDISIAALGLLYFNNVIRDERCRRMLSHLELPESVTYEQFASTPVSQVIREQLPAALDHLDQLVTTENFEDIMKQWSPLNALPKRIVLFLTNLGRLYRDKEDTSGLTNLQKTFEKEMLRRQTRKGDLQEGIPVTFP